MQKASSENYSNLECHSVLIRPRGYCNILYLPIGKSMTEPGSYEASFCTWVVVRTVVKLLVVW